MLLGLELSSRSHPYGKLTHPVSPTPGGDVETVLVDSVLVLVSDVLWLGSTRSLSSPSYIM